MQTRDKIHTNSEGKYNYEEDATIKHLTLKWPMKRQTGLILTVAHSLDKVLESLRKFTRLQRENIHI